MKKQKFELKFVMGSSSSKPAETSDANGGTGAHNASDNGNGNTRESIQSHAEHN